MDLSIPEEKYKLVTDRDGGRDLSPLLCKDRVRVGEERPQEVTTSGEEDVEESEEEVLRRHSFHRYTVSNPTLSRLL